ncbi:MAG: hypothetical protein M1833_004716 [Piccolia ochrophora]|nr:MAG: hypothetical protein M1833_004716 [Piccolia ochrophora]
MATYHRKIELQSPDDLRYLHTNVSRAAREKLDLHLPPSAAPAGEDALRRRVEEIVDEYVSSTFSLAAPSISVNGLDCPALPSLSTSTTPEVEGTYLPLFLSHSRTHQTHRLHHMNHLKQTTHQLTTSTPTQTEFEPFSSSLASRVQALHASLEQETLLVAQLRRDAPARAAEEYRRSWTEGSEATKGSKGTQGTEPHPPTNQPRSTDTDSTGLDVARITAALAGREEEVGRTWEEALERLVALKEGERKTLPGTTAKLERAKAAVEYVESR